MKIASFCYKYDFSFSFQSFWFLKLLKHCKLQCKTSFFMKSSDFFFSGAGKFPAGDPPLAPPSPPGSWPASRPAVPASHPAIPFPLGIRFLPSLAILAVGQPVPPSHSARWLRNLLPGVAGRVASPLAKPVILCNRLYGFLHLCVFFANEQKQGPQLRPMGRTELWALHLWTRWFESFSCKFNRWDLPSQGLAT